MMDSPDAPFVKMTQAWRRCAYRWELHHLLRLCRLAVEAEYSDFGGSGISYGNQLAKGFALDIPAYRLPEA
jgi:hypothetical protein